MMSRIDQTAEALGTAPRQHELLLEREPPQGLLPGSLPYSADEDLARIAFILQAYPQGIRELRSPLSD